MIDVIIAIDIVFVEEIFKPVNGFCDGVKFMLDKILDEIKNYVNKLKSEIEALESDIEEKDNSIQELEEELYEIKSRFELD